MHKGVILLVAAKSKDNALEEVKKFLEQYGDGDVWDWYQIGGRWNDILAPKELKDKFYQKVDSEILIKQEGNPWISQQQVDDNQELLQSTWEELGLLGNNPYCNHYHLPDEGNAYDIMKLTSCIETVKEWIKDTNKEAEELFEKIVKSREEAKEGKYDMSGYYAKQYSNIIGGYFSFETNVYNISTGEAETIPKAIDDYYAVMVDMHN
jgi:hypothetical protein